jgi:hypothetical protein
MSVAMRTWPLTGRQRGVPGANPARVPPGEPGLAFGLCQAHGAQFVGKILGPGPGKYRLSSKSRPIASRSVGSMTYQVPGHSVQSFVRAFEHLTI